MSTVIEGPRPLVAASRGIVWVIFALAVIIGIAILVGGTVAIVNDFAGGRVDLTLVADTALPQAALHCATCTVTGTFDTAAVAVTGLSSGLAAIALAGDIARVFTNASLCVLVALLAWRILRGGVFRDSVALTVALAGLVLTVGGLVSQAGNAMASGGAAAEIDGTGHGYWPIAGTFDPTVPVFGVVLLLVGLAFGYGSRLQKDTEGLV